MVKIKYTSSVKIAVNNERKTCTELVLQDFKEEIESPNVSIQPPTKKLQQQQDIEKHLSDLTDHFDSKLQSLNNLILKELTEKIDKIEKSVMHIGHLHDTLLDKIRKLEQVISQLKNEKDVDVQMLEIRDLKRQISLLQAKVSAIQEQKKLLISRMYDFDSMQHVHDIERYTFGTENQDQKTDLVAFEVNLITSPNPFARQGQDVKQVSTRVPHRIWKHNIPKNLTATLKFIQIKNKFLKAARFMRFKQNKGHAI